MRYTVRALGDGGLVSVAVEASDALDARAQVAARRLQPISADPDIGRPPRPGGRGGFSLTLFSQELLALLEAGLTLTEALDALLAKETKADSRAVIEGLARALTEGRRFSQALAAQPDRFPPLYAGLMQAAERTGALSQSLARYLDYRNRLDALRSRLASALLYPAILSVVGLAVTLFLLIYVVPRFAAVYQGTGRELPWLSQQMIAWGVFAAAHGKMLAVSAGLGTLAVAAAGRAWQRRGGPLGLLRRIPGIRERAATFELARLYLSLGTLLEGGLAILEALRLCEGLLAPDTRDRLRAAQAAIDRGESVSAAFDGHGLATPVGLRLMRVGERTGRLGEMLGRAARFHDGEIGRWLDLFARGFEPLLMAAIGGVVGLIVVLLYLPIFDLAGSLG